MNYHDWGIETIPEYGFRKDGTKKRDEISLIEYGIDEDSMEYVFFKKYIISYPYENGNGTQKTSKRINFFSRGKKDVKITFVIDEGIIQEYRIYRGRERTHVIDALEGLDEITTNLRLFADDALYGCLRNKVEYDWRSTNPSITLPWHVFKRVILGIYSTEFYKGKVSDMLSELSKL